jgi:uncharacterized membrane protein
MAAAPVGGPAVPDPQPAYNPPPPPVVSAAGMEDNLAGALCYLLGFITGIVFLVLEPYNKNPFVRFHAFQSIFFSLGWIAISIALSIVFMIMGFALQGLWFIFLPIRALIGLLGFLLWLFCMYKAYNRERYMLPIVGPLAAKQSGT